MVHVISLQLSPTRNTSLCVRVCVHARVPQPMTCTVSLSPAWPFKNRMDVCVCVAARQLKNVSPLKRNVANAERQSSPSINYNSLFYPHFLFFLKKISLERAVIIHPLVNINCRLLSEVARKVRTQASTAVWFTLPSLLVMKQKQFTQVLKKTTAATTKPIKLIVQMESLIVMFNETQKPLCFISDKLCREIQVRGHVTSYYRFGLVHGCCCHTTLHNIMHGKDAFCEFG